MTPLNQPATRTSLEGFRPEIKLLLYCVRTQIDDQTAEQIRMLVCEKIDWQYFVQMASRHKIESLLYKNLSNICPLLVPEDILSQLKNTFDKQSARVNFMAKELVKLLDLFCVNQISVIPFKGPILASLAYDDIELRQFGDLDFLVHKKDLLKAKNLLLSHGYKLTYPKYKLSTTQEAIYIERKHDLAFIWKDNALNRLSVELQWTSLDKRFSVPLKFEELWDRLTLTTFLGTNIPSLSPEDWVLLLCLEAYKEYWVELRRICDIARYINNHSQLDWNQLIERAENFRIYRIVLINLALVKELFNVDLPDSLSQRALGDSKINSLKHTIYKWFFKEPKRVSEIIHKAFFPLIYILQTREHFQDKFQYCLFSLLPNEKDWQLVQLPLFLNFLYYIIRPIRVARILWDYVKNRR